MGMLSTIAGGLAGLFVKKVITTEPDGARVTRRKARKSTPVLNYFFPEVGFPPIDAGLLSGLLSLGF